jgi:uncharacterized protein (TIGR03086 family)
MTATAARYRRIAAAFTEVHDGVEDWTAPTPCEGWVARDVVDHLCEWVGAYFFGTWDLGPAPTTWPELDGRVQAALDDPAVAQSVRDTRFGPATFESQVDMIVVGDVFIHTWDLAQASGRDVRLDPDEVRSMLAGVEPMIHVLVESGQYGPPVDPPAGADEQARLLSLLGRRV